MASPAFQMYPNEWLGSATTAQMTPAQEGAFFRLLCYDWNGDGIPDDDNALAALSRLGEGWFKGGSQVVRKCFAPHPKKPGHLTNIRLQKERQKQVKWASKSAEGGRRSAEARKNTSQNDVFEGSFKDGSRVVEPKGNSSSSFSSSIITPKVPKELGFAEFWACYPNKVKKQSALAAWIKHGCCHSVVVILAAVEKAKVSQDWRKESGQFIPHPSSWLNQQRWTDEGLSFGEAGTSTVKPMRSMSEQIAAAEREIA